MAQVLESDDPNNPKYWCGYTPKQKKELQAADHKSIEYSPFTKNFYNEVPELGRFSDAEVAQMRFEMENIRVKGKVCPHSTPTPHSYEVYLHYC